MRWRRIFAGAPAQVAEVRRFVACLLEGCPAREALVCCASELSANAVVHTASGRGGFFVVEVACRQGGTARVSVTDAGAPTEPAPGVPVTDEASDGDVGDLPVSGLGLALVAAAASHWGYSNAGSGRTVWAEASWPVRVMNENSAVTRQSRFTGSRNWRGGAGAARRDFPEPAAPSLATPSILAALMWGPTGC
jgi:anti-sigma regulatory factor (Ser/Thr protein kinase)